jgi:hypothetical protein
MEFFVIPAALLLIIEAMINVDELLFFKNEYFIFNSFLFNNGRRNNFHTTKKVNEFSMELRDGNLLVCGSE